MYELATIDHTGHLQTPVHHLTAGVVVSFVVGLISLAWLVRWLERGRFALFAWWCIPFGAAVLIWQWTSLNGRNPAFHRVDSGTSQYQCSSQVVTVAQAIRPLKLQPAQDFDSKSIRSSALGI